MYGDVLDCTCYHRNAGEIDLTYHDYMQGRCSHQQFYFEVSKTLGIDPTKMTYQGQSVVDLARIFYHEGDEFLNRINLSWWDCWASSLIRSDHFKKVLKDYGLVDTLSVRVCILKAAVIARIGH